MPLTDASVRNAKPAEKAYKIADAKGLYLLVKPSGKYWRFDYSFGSRKTMAFGVYPEISLSRARELLKDARNSLDRDVDPGHTKRIAKAMPGAVDDSFEVIGREWLERNKKKWAQSHYSKVKLRLENEVFPWLGRRHIRQIAPVEVLAVAQRVEKRGAVETAHRVLQYSGAIFRYAVATSRAESDPTRDLRGAIAAPVKGSFASIKDGPGIGKLLRAIDAYPASYNVGAALRFAPLVFVRPKELRLMEWSEVDMKAGEWRIPKEKMKKRRPHIVPLSTQALAILNEMRPFSGTGKLVFPGQRKDRPLSENTLTAGLRRIGYSGEEMTAHGFRSTASTTLNENSWPTDVIELQLAHVEGNSVKAAYNYAQHLPKRREMMQWWADHLDKLKA